MPACADQDAKAVFADIKAWRGISIGVIERDARFCYCVRLIHADGSIVADILASENEAKAIATWRFWTSSLGLPRLIENAQGEFEALERRMGELLVRDRKPRRRGSPLFSRRPRRMALRGQGALKPGVAIYRNEREIIARN